ncbi:acyl-CoA dehydrogenase [Ureibacillus endophyticus]|uniref:Acyl-CoA dehydrogenase n=1 Tax=Ureibacillus endophyticus TaxID=1978490 RepID=A0A494YY66_9BACL|nr:acyl-CoA dehydrogenase [Lysinibacillus endophyticus]RKQ15162.1 acyl-CoA dehydrogenase [Lysinibacillus endophyticus]
MAEFMYSSREHKFILKEWLDSEKILNFDSFKDTFDLDDIDMILDQALLAAKEVAAPVNIDADRIGCELKDGKVTTPPSFKKLYKFMCENGYGPSLHDPDDENRLPEIIKYAVLEYFGAAIPSFDYPGMSGGVARLIHSFGTENQKKVFLPKMYSGEWGGTMALTEPHCGSDVGEITSTAYPTDTPGVYKIKGTKCFITAGDHDLTDNIVHLMLARIEGAAPGTKGISLFIVPKIWVNEDGSLGEPNDVLSVGLEHKLGMKGSATVMLDFGSEDICRGYLVGNPPDENNRAEGMAQMFQMMNEARQGVGSGAVNIAQAAYNYSLQYAKERIQGKAITNPRGPRVRIVEHEDVRRMLMFQKSIIEACRAMVFKTAYLLDLINDSPDKEEKKWADGLVGINTPIIKAYPTDMVWQTVAEAIQIHGGYGFIEEYPVAQYARDSKILSLYEGTNFIQSLDLVGRKWSQNNGQLFVSWLEEINETIGKNKNLEGFEREYEIMTKAKDSYRQMLNEFTSKIQEDIRLMTLFSTRILHATAMLWGGSLLLEHAAIAVEKLKELNSNHADYSFYNGKVHSAKFYIRNIVPDLFKICEVIKDGDTSTLDIPEEAF